MRIGIFSDVHANLEALQAVLSAYQQTQIDRYMCLGDIVGYGADPNECCQLVRDLTDVVVLGNHDAACSGRLSTEWFNSAARVAVQEHQRMLDTAHMSWLAQLPYCIALDDMLLCHGSPYQQEEFPYILDETDVEAIMLHVAAHPPLIFVGHTHRGTTFIARETPVLRVWEDTRATIRILPGNRYVFNVGSVGQPRDGDWRASYAIFDTEARTFELRRSEYDVDTASGKIERLGFPVTLSERLFLGL
ncbi:MAG TPA: metallophosphoesterase family protein [Candidatus Tectomicrobia bacterium]|nr:metallophosphoesterase family protein [Candidatus Tectomicrobia bacterium]